MTMNRQTAKVMIANDANLETADGLDGVTVVITMTGTQLATVRAALSFIAEHPNANADIRNDVMPLLSDLTNELL